MPVPSWSFAMAALISSSGVAAWRRNWSGASLAQMPNDLRSKEELTWQALRALRRHSVFDLGFCTDRLRSVRQISPPLKGQSPFRHCLVYSRKGLSTFSGAYDPYPGKSNSSTIRSNACRCSFVSGSAGGRGSPQSMPNRMPSHPAGRL